MKTILRNIRFLGILCLMMLSCTHLSAQRRGMFRIVTDYDLSLTLEQYQKLVSSALASIEKERPKYLNYINTEVLSDYSGRIFEVDKEEKPHIPSSSLFHGLESNTRYCKILFPCKAKHSEGFPQGYVAKVYLRTDNGVPFGIEWGDSGKEWILKYEEAPALVKTSLMPTQWMVPDGKPNLTEEASERWVGIARQAVKENLPDVYDMLAPNADPAFMRFQYHEGSEAAVPGIKVMLFGRNLKLIVGIWEHTGQVFDIRFDEP